MQHSKAVLVRVRPLVITQIRAELVVKSVLQKDARVNRDMFYHSRMVDNVLSLATVQVILYSLCIVFKNYIISSVYEIISIA